MEPDSVEKLPTLDYRSPKTTQNEGADRRIRISRALAILAVLFIGLIVLAAASLSINGYYTDKDTMRRDVGHFADKPGAAFEIKHVFTGSATKYYRIRMTPAEAAATVEQLSGAKSVVKVSSKQRSRFGSDPSWWIVDDLKDVTTFEYRTDEGAGWTYLVKSISPSTGWVYICYPGH